MYDSTFTFKTRRKHHLLLTCLLVLVQSIASIAIPIQCPDPCDCYLNSNGLPSARCSEIYPNQSPFENIHVLVLRPLESRDECNIPTDLARIFPQLNFLYLMNCSLTSIPSNIFKDLRSLQEVDLSNNHIKKFDSSVFVNNIKLRYANLQNNPFHIADKPFLISKSLWELDLTHCGIHHIPYNAFKNLTHLKILTLYDNKLRSLDDNTLPNTLKVINLGKNHIKKVPIAELRRLKGIRQIDLSENPINCTCELIGFQDYMITKPVTFLNGIECQYPREYSGRRLQDLPEYEMCDAVAQASTDGCENGEICTNQIILEEEPTTKKNDYMDDFERDQVVPVKKEGIADYAAEGMQSDSADEGSGNGDGTDLPEGTDDLKPVEPQLAAIKPVEKPETKPTAEPENKLSNETETTSSAKTDITPLEPSETTENSKTTIEQTTPDKETVTQNNNGVTKYDDEISSSTNTTKKDDEAAKTEAATAPSIVSDAPPHPEPTNASSVTREAANTVLLSSEKPIIPDTIGTEPVRLTTENKTHYDPYIQSTSHSDSSNFNFGYIIPCLAILVVIIICLGVYLSQRSSHKKNWDPNEEDGGDSAEMQDTSLLSNKTKTPIVKNTKYPTEGTSEQTERLMGETPTAPSAWEHLEEPTENGTPKHANGDKLLNGQDKKEPIECAIAKVTTLPDSIPRTPVIRNA